MEVIKIQTFSWLSGQLFKTLDQREQKLSSEIITNSLKSFVYVFNRM